jgi:hypothetical protein
MTAQKATARKEPKTTQEKRIVWRKKSAVAQNIELYSSAYRMAWIQISPLQRREQPDIALRLHASIRSQVKKGATDPYLIASEALKALREVSPKRRAATDPSFIAPEALTPFEK